MLNISFLACTKVELWDLTVCIVVNNFKVENDLDLGPTKCPISKLSELFSFSTMFLNFITLDLSF